MAWIFAQRSKLAVNQAKAMERSDVSTPNENFNRYDTASHLEIQADIAAHLTVCAEEDDPSLIPGALGDVACASNMTPLAAKTRVTRMGLYKALTGKRIPGFTIVYNVAPALGFKIAAVSAWSLCLESTDAPLRHVRYPSSTGYSAGKLELGGSCRGVLR